MVAHDDAVRPSSHTRVEAADIAVAKKVGRYRDVPAVRIAGHISEIADQAPLFTLCGTVIAVSLVVGRPDALLTGVRMLSSVAVATAIKSAIKGLISRTRPNVLLDEGHYELEALGPDGGDRHSFPSGHTAGAVAAARAVARNNFTAAGPAYTAAAAIAAIQVPRAKHYPLDLAGGLMVGVVAEALVNAAILQLGRRLRPTRSDIA